MHHRTSTLFLSSLTFTLTLAACGGSPVAPIAENDAASTPNDAAAALTDSGTPVDAAIAAPDAAMEETGPFVCQAHAYTCPTRAALDACEMGFGDPVCMRLPLIDCTGPGAPDPGTCPSADQICRLEGGATGFCTHSCSDDEDCPLPDGGFGTCGAGNNCLR